MKLIIQKHVGRDIRRGSKTEGLEPARITVLIKERLAPGSLAKNGAMGGRRKVVSAPFASHPGPPKTSLTPGVGT